MKEKYDKIEYKIDTVTPNVMRHGVGSILKNNQDLWEVKSELVELILTFDEAIIKKIVIGQNLN